MSDREAYFKNGCINDDGKAALKEKQEEYYKRYPELACEHGHHSCKEGDKDKGDDHHDKKEDHHDDKDDDGMSWSEGGMTVSYKEEYAKMLAAGASVAALATLI